MMTASTPRRSWSAYQSSSASPTRCAAWSASTSSQEPGKRTTPNFMPRRAPDPAAGSLSPRSAGWRATARTSPRAAWRPRPRARPAGPRGRARRPRSRGPAARARRSGPAGRGARPWAGSARGPSRLGARPLQPGREGLAREQLVGADVALARGGDDVVGDRGRGRRLVPPGAGRPVADVLLVEGGLAVAGLVLVGRPEARGVRG